MTTGSTRKKPTLCQGGKGSGTWVKEGVLILPVLQPFPRAHFRHRNSYAQAGSCLGQHRVLVCWSPGCCPRGCVCSLVHWHPTRCPRSPADTAAQHLSPSSSLQSHAPNFPTLLRQFWPPGPPSPAKYSKPTSKCTRHHKPCLRKQETNISHSFLLLSPLRGRSSSSDTLKPGRKQESPSKNKDMSHPWIFYNSAFSYPTFSTPGPSCSWLLHIIAQLPQHLVGDGSFSPDILQHQEEGKSAHWQRAKNVDK